MTWLTSLSGPAILLLCVGGAALFALAVVLVAVRVFPHERRDAVGVTAAAYMTVLGSLFAILTGFLINSEYGTLRQTQNLVAVEVAAASQLAYGAASLPPVDATLVQAELVAALDAVVAREWSHLGREPQRPSPAADEVAALSQGVVAFGSRPYTPAAATDAMQGALAGMTEARSQRIVVASQILPAPLFALSVVTGAALILGALLVALRSGPRFALVAAGIVLVVGLDLAAILAISAPFDGPFIVPTAPIAQVADEVRNGGYLPWVVQR
ncbi:MAG: hypothetical protein ACO3KD_04250 [Gaiellales bacterium]